MPDPGCDDSPQLQLCFNRAHFQRSDFNVERFVNLTRKRATLDQLQNDLRIYLRYLQNSMIELINDDYADFVNLSSGLAALRESVDKVSSDVQFNWSSFATSIAEIKNCSDAIEHNLADLIRCQKLQISQGDKLALFQSIQILCEFVDRIDDRGNENRDSFCWYSKLALLISAVELWLARTQNVEFLPSILKSKDECYRKISEILLEALENEMFGHSKASGNLSIFITLIRITHATELAICRIVNGLVEKKIVRLNVEHGKRLDHLLENALNQTLELRKGWAENAKRNRQFTLEVVTFIDTCLLNFIGSFLEERFSAVLTPSDSQLFHCCYRHISDFVAKWPSRGNAQRGLFHSILEKFNLVVFFKLASQPLLNPLRALSAPESFEIQVPIDNDESKNVCIAPYTNCILSTLDALYSPEVFLPPLSNKFWEFTLQQMDLYMQWAQKLTDHFSCSEVPEDEKSPPPTENRSNRSKSPNLLTDLSSLSPTNCQQKVPNWLQLSALYRDLYLFDAALFRFCLNTIWTYLRELRVDTTPFGQCLSRFSEQLAQKKTVIAESISSQLCAELTKNLSAVGDIPRQYRWTKRPFPIGFSAYLSKAFVVCEEFSEKSKEFGWTDAEVRNILTKVLDKSVDGFCDKAEKVLESVEQTGSSLLRFKQRKMGHLQPQHEGETDEAKIRAQIRFDTNFVRQRTTVDYGMDEIERLAKVEERAASVNSEGGMKVEERASSVNAEGVI